MTKSPKAFGRRGRSPVIAVRVPAPLHKRIIDSAKASGRSMSEEMASLLERGFQWQAMLAKLERLFELNGP